MAFSPAVIDALVCACPRRHLRKLPKASLEALGAAQGLAAVAVTYFVNSQPLTYNWTLSAVKLTHLANVEALTANVLSLHVVGGGFACVQGPLSSAPAASRRHGTSTQLCQDSRALPAPRAAHFRSCAACAVESLFVSSADAWAALEKKIKPGNRGFSQNHFLLSVKLLLMCPPCSPTTDVPNTVPAKSEKVMKS